MADKLAITKENGENINAELVSCFAIPDIQKHFVISTLNEIDPNGLVVLNVSEIINNKLAKVINDDDWSRIKQVMRSIISNSSGTFKYLPAMAAINAGIEYTRNISVQGVAKDQLVKDYYEKKPGGEVGGTTAKVEEVVNEAPMNPALGNVPVAAGTSEVAPGIVEVQSQGLDDDLGKPDSNVITIDSTPKATNPGDSGDSTVSQVFGNVPVFPEAPASPPIEAGQVIANNDSRVSEGSINVNPGPVVMPEMNNSNMSNVNNQGMQNPNLMSAQQQFMNSTPQAAMMQNQNPMMNYGNAGMASMPNGVMAPNQQFGNGASGYKSVDQVINDAKNMFMDNAINMANAIFANVADSLRAKEEELRNREMMLAQREAMSQQTMMQQPIVNGMNQMPYGGMMQNYYNANQYMGGQK